MLLSLVQTPMGAKIRILYQLTLIRYQMLTVVLIKQFVQPIVLRYLVLVQVHMIGIY